MRAKQLLEPIFLQEQLEAREPSPLISGITPPAVSADSVLLRHQLSDTGTWAIIEQSAGGNGERFTSCMLPSLLDTTGWPLDATIRAGLLVIPLC